MIPYRLNPLGFSAWQRLIDTNTRFLLYGDLTDRASGTAIENHGLQSNGDYVYAPADAASSYAVIPANALPADVFTTSHDWTFEISFFVPENWQSLAGTKDACGIFGYVSLPPLRFDLMAQTANGNFVVGSVLDTVGSIVTGNNHFIFQRAAGGETKWKFNGSTAGRLFGSVGELREHPLSLLWIAGTRYGYPLKIRYIRISNCLRLS